MNQFNVHYLCDQCDYKTTVQTKLKEHMKTKHDCNQSRGTGYVNEKTNGETVEWIKVTNETVKSEDEWYQAGIIFFGDFPGIKKTFKKWKNNFIAEHKSKKQESQRYLMKTLGGTGKHGEIPPNEYFPDNMSHFNFIQNKVECKTCEQKLNNYDEVKQHLQMFHPDAIKKAYSKEALDNVKYHQHYEEWLDRITVLDTNEIQLEKQKLEKMKDANNVLEERNEILKNADQNTFVKVGQKDNIIETKRTIYTTKSDGTLKKSVVTEQLANVTKRQKTKRNSCDA